ncbi:MAG: hypothetical protein QM791_21625 [Ferruginibacter sp.]
MKVLFDFELYNKRDEDGVLIYIMDAFKRSIFHTLNPFANEIKEDGGYVVVTIKHQEFSIFYHYNQTAEIFNKVQPLLNNIDWGVILQETAHKLASFRDN